MAQFSTDSLKAGTNLLRTCSLMAEYAGQATFGKLKYHDPQERLEFFTRNVSQYARRVLKLFNVDVEVKGVGPEIMKKRNFLVVSNHMSYVDILLLSSIQPCVFVTSVDLGEQFFLGPMAEMGGSIFVERRHRGQINRDIEVIANVLKAGHNVVIYPEGTSSNGERVLPFKRSLLMSAVHAGVDILPLTLKYVEIDGEPFSEKNRDRVCWYGDMPFFPHFLSLMKVRSIRAELYFHEPLAVTKESTRVELADACYRLISQTYGEPFKSKPAGEEKEVG